MPLNGFGEAVQPRYCRVSVSQDKTKLALTFRSEERAPVTIVLPIEGAAGLQRQLAQGLFLLGKHPVVGQPQSAATADTNAAAATDAAEPAVAAT